MFLKMRCGKFTGVSLGDEDGITSLDLFISGFFCCKHCTTYHLSTLIVSIYKKISFSSHSTSDFSQTAHAI